MELTFKILLVIFGFFALDRCMLFYEKLYFAKHGRLITDFDEADRKDFEKG
jgi:hypothetical protein